MSDRDTLAKGMKFGSSTVVLGHIAIAFVALATGSLALLDPRRSHAVAYAILALPWLGLLGWVAWFIKVGEPRTAAGVGLSLPAMAGFALLLLAACFGLITLGFR